MNFDIKELDYVEFYVCNAKQYSYYLSKGFGFDLKAYSGLETGEREKVSYFLEQGNCRIVVTSSLRSNNEIANFVNKHGDGVGNIAFNVSRLPENLSEVTTDSDDDGSVLRYESEIYGDIKHSFIDRSAYRGRYLPNFQDLNTTPLEGIGINRIDHLVGVVHPGLMNNALDVFIKNYGFEIENRGFSDKDTNTTSSGMYSQVVQHLAAGLKYLIIEPVDGPKKSQIEEYLEFFNGPGIQHVAFTCNNIVEAVERMESSGIQFLPISPEYYETLGSRFDMTHEEVQPYKERNILVDRDKDGFVLQCFTKPLSDKPTLFFEFIERKGSKGFGKGNVRALFEAMEREQIARGNS